MKTFQFLASDDLDAEGIAFAVEKMAESSRQLAKHNGGDHTPLYVNMLTDKDIAKFAAESMAEVQQLQQTEQMKANLVAILLAVAKRYGGLRITQSELDETKGWNLNVGPKDNVMFVQATSPSGLVLAAPGARLN